MTASLLIAAAEPGQALPPASNAMDMAFAYAAVALLIVLVVWQSRSSRD